MSGYQARQRRRLRRAEQEHATQAAEARRKIDDERARLANASPTIGIMSLAIAIGNLMDEFKSGCAAPWDDQFVCLHQQRDRLDEVIAAVAKKAAKP